MDIRLGSSMKLVALSGDVAVAEHAPMADVVTVGRQVGCDVVIARLSVSRAHATISSHHGQAVVRDIGSTNGTFVNGQRIWQPHTLGHNDVLGFGCGVSMLRFVDAGKRDLAWPGLRYDDRRDGFMVHERLLKLTVSQERLLWHFYRSGMAGHTRASCAEAIWERAYDHDRDGAALDRVFDNLSLRLRQVDAALVLPMLR